MIKGVNRQVVEVQETDCDYFERILFFVKPEYASLSEGKIREHASLIAGKTSAAPPTRVKRNLLLDAAKGGGVLVCGLLLGLLLSLLLR